MDSRLLLIFLVTLFISSIVLAQSSSAPAPSAQPAMPIAKPQRTFDRLFARLDKDRDGFISRDEATRSRWLKKQFDAIDTNQDGKLSKDEVRAYRAAMPDDWSAYLRSSLPPGPMT